MQRLTTGRRSLRRHRRNDPFHRAKHGDLDILMPPPYDTSDASQREARQRVEELVKGLQPDGLDGNSRDVLNNLINAWMDQELARLASQRDERKAVIRMLIGLAREEVSWRQRRYEADLARVQLAHRTLAATYRQLTGEDLDAPTAPDPEAAEAGPVTSTLHPYPPDFTPEGPGVPMRRLNGNGHPAAADGTVPSEGA